VIAEDCQHIRRTILRDHEGNGRGGWAGPAAALSIV
jgi:hypothetical protein